MCSFALPRTCPRRSSQFWRNWTRTERNFKWCKGIELRVSTCTCQELLELFHSCWWYDANPLLLTPGVVLIRRAFSLAEQQTLCNWMTKYGDGEVAGAGSFWVPKNTRKSRGITDMPILFLSTLILRVGFWTCALKQEWMFPSVCVLHSSSNASRLLSSRSLGSLLSEIRQGERIVPWYSQNESYGVAVKLLHQQGPDRMALR